MVIAMITSIIAKIRRNVLFIINDFLFNCSSVLVRELTVKISKGKWVSWQPFNFLIEAEDMALSCAGLSFSATPNDDLRDSLDKIGQSADQHQDENIRHALTHINNTGYQIKPIPIESANLPKHNCGYCDRDNKAYSNIEGSLTS